MLTDDQNTFSASSREAVPLSRASHSDRGAAGDEYVPKLQQNAEKLRNVAQQVEAFLMRQIDRLQRELEQAETWGDRHELERMTEEFQQMRQKWDAERQSERNRLQDDSQRLAEAWQKLEAEQREMLKYRVASNKMAGLNTGRVVSRSASPLSPVHPTTASTETVMSCTSGGVATAAPSSLKNQLQFQQLRREMMEHARQRGKR